MRLSIVKRAVLGGVSYGVLGIALLAGSPAAYAQDVLATDTEPAGTDLSEAGPTEAEEVEGEVIFITASRVQSSGFTAPTPTTVLGAEQIGITAPTQIADALALIPSFRTTSQPSSASTYANLRSIGANRTLVLVDGRRHVPTFSDATVDLGVIPAILVARAEVVTGGASASWGSDAVAGVVNLILKENLEGIEGTVQAGISEYGDDANYLASLAAGTSFADGRGSIMLGAEYSSTDGVRGLQQPNYSRPWAGRGSVGNANFATNGLPGTIYADDVRRADLYEGGLVTGGALQGIKFLPGGELGQFGYGEVFGNSMIGGSDNFGHTPTPGGDLKLPFERYSVMGRASFDLSNSLTIFAEGTYAHSMSDGFAQPGRNGGTVSAANPTCTMTLAPANLRNIAVPITNPYLSAEMRDRMEAAGVTCFNMGRVFYDPGMGEYRARSGSPSIYRGVVGASGDLVGDWSWDAYYQYGRNRYIQQRAGNMNVINFRRAIDAVLDNGNIVCRVNADASTANDDPACRPMNIFGYGSPSQESIDYVTGTSSFEMITKQQVAALSASGKLFDIWAGPVAAATGVEYRKESIDAASDPDSQAGNWNSSNRKAIAGEYNVKEVFAELAIPLLRDVPLIYAFDINLAARYTDYSSSGGVTTWKAGASWDVTDEVRIRATQSRDIRAGNLGELFTPTAVLTTNLRDPRTSSTIQVPVTTRGNRTLGPERADTFTAGVAYQPSWLQGFRASVDYYSIDIAGEIGSIGGNDVLERCFMDQLQQFCSLVTMGPNDAITGVTVQFENLDRFKTSGVDIEASYRTGVNAIFGSGNGDVLFRVLANYVHNSERIAASNATVVNIAGEYTLPHWTVQGLVSYTGDRLGAALDLRWFGGGTIDNELVAGAATLDGVNINSVDSSLYTNLTMSYDILGGSGRERAELFLRISNLFDVAPPFPDTGGGVFDPVGRAYRVGLRFAL